MRATALKVKLACCTLRISELMDYCQWDSFAPVCPSGTLILIESAVYGRMDYGKCIDRDYGYVGCQTDVLLSMDSRCSGRRNCNIRIPDEQFDRTRPCPKDLTRYLRASYKCIPGKGSLIIYGLGGGAAGRGNRYNSRESPYFRLNFQNILFGP